MQINGITMLDKYLEPYYEKGETIPDLIFNDFEDEEVPESVFWNATHQYECMVYNEMERNLSWRDYVG